MKAISGKRLCQLVEEKGWELKRISMEVTTFMQGRRHCSYIGSRTWQQAIEGWITEASDENCRNR